MKTKPATLNPRRSFIQLAAAGTIVIGAALLWQTQTVSAAETAVQLPAPTVDLKSEGTGPKKVVFAGGCFWGVQGVFQHVKGVQRAVSGYTGGAGSTAHYEVVSGGRTGHAESVEVTYDPQQISYGALLQIFFSVVHDPTQLNRQGPDSGTQYRSEVFTTSAEQTQATQAYIAQLDAAHVFGKPIVTRVESNPGFYPAETYHQDFLTENPNHLYIVINDMPKIDQLKQLFPQRYRNEPVLVKQSSSKGRA